MARERKVVQLGPWNGGMNTRDDVRLLPDNEVETIINWDVGDDGSLKPRRGWAQVGSGSTKAFPIAMYVTSSDNSRAVFSRMTQLNVGLEKSKFFWVKGPVPAVNTLKNAAGADIQRDGRFVTGFLYNGKIYFVPDSDAGAGLAAGVGFRKTNIENGDPVDVAAMPAGRYSWVVNDRAFIFHPRKGRLYWSKATDADVWLTTGVGPAGEDVGGYVDIDPNDNPFLDCVVVHDTVYFIRMDKIYTFRFNADPSIDGQINQIANSEGAVAGVSYNNQLVLVTPKGLFYFTNGYFTLITDKVMFTDALGELVTQFEYNGMTVIDHTLIVNQLIYNAPLVDLGPTNYRQTVVNMRTSAVSVYESQGTVPTPYGRTISDGKYTYRLGKASGNLAGEAIVLTIAHDRTQYGNVGNKEDYYALITKWYDFSTTRSVWKRLRTLTIDYDIDVERNQKQVDLTVWAETLASGGQGVVESATLVSGDMGRIVIPNLRFRTLQLMLEIDGGDANVSDAGVYLRNFLALISHGEFEQKKAG